MIDTQFTIGWALIVIAGLLLETVALLRKGRGDTASEHVWWLLRKSRLGWFVGAGVMVWLTVHFLGFGIVDGWIASW